MQPSLQLLLVGMSWRTAPVDSRGRYAVPSAELEARLRALGELDGVHERFVLSTCNRTEVLVAAAPGEALEDAVRNLFFAGADREHLYTFHGVQAVIHLFRVATGLDSMVLGETEILGQVKNAVATTRELSCIGKMLDPLLQQALSVGKRVRSQTAIGQGSLSVARVGVELGLRVYGDFSRVTALVLGAGDTAKLVSKHLAAENTSRLVVLNRTLERARELAGELDAQAADLGELESWLARANVVFSCLDGAGGLVVPELFDRRVLRKRDRPLLLVDLSVPRVVAPAVADLDGVLTYDLDDVKRVVEQNEAERRRASEESSSILVSEVHKFVSKRTYAAFTPAIDELHRRFQETSDDVLDDVAGSTASPEMMRLASELSRRLLDVSLSQLKASARHASSAEALDLEYRQFLDNL